MPTSQALDVVRRVADIAVPMEVITSLDRSRVPVAERIDARPRRRRNGTPRLPSRLESVADAYQRFIGRQVPPGRRASFVDRGRFWQEWWDLDRLRDVLPYAAFVAIGRPWGLAERGRGLPPFDAPSLAPGQTVSFAVGGGGRPYVGADWSFPEEHGTWTMGREAVLRLKVAGSTPRESPLALVFAVAPLLSSMRPHLQVDVVVNHRKLARWRFEGQSGSPERPRGRGRARPARSFRSTRGPADHPSADHAELGRPGDRQPASGPAAQRTVAAGSGPGR